MQLKRLNIKQNCAFHRSLSLTRRTYAYINEYFKLPLRLLGIHKTSAFRNFTIFLLPLSLLYSSDNNLPK